MTVIHSMFRRIVRNDAIRLDPPEIYNWRVLALAASVSESKPRAHTLVMIDPGPTTNS